MNFFADDFICEFDLRPYPFDIQVCRTDLILKGLDRNRINMVNGSLMYFGATNVQQYVVLDVALLKDIVSSAVLFRKPSNLP